MVMMTIAFSCEPEPRRAPTAWPVSGVPKQARGQTGTSCGAGQQQLPTCSVIRAGASRPVDQKELRGRGGAASVG